MEIAINFISSKDAKKECVMHMKSKNTEFMSSINVDDVVDELFKILFSRYQNNLETSMRGTDFILIQSNFCITNVIQ